MKIKTKYSFDLKRRIKHFTSIQFVGALYRNLFLICDFNNQFYLINSTDFKMSFIRQVNLNQISSYKINLSNLKIKPMIFELDNL